MEPGENLFLLTLWAVKYDQQQDLKKKHFNRTDNLAWMKSQMQNLLFQIRDILSEKKCLPPYILPFSHLFCLNDDHLSSQQVGSKICQYPILGCLCIYLLCLLKSCNLYDTSGRERTATILLIYNHFSLPPLIFTRFQQIIYYIRK